MIERDLVDALIEFYEQCQYRGWCQVKSEKGGFLTIRSSDTNFTHVQPIFGTLPEKVLVSPRLSAKNVKLLKGLVKEFDRLRLITITPYRFYYRVRITLGNGKIVRKFRIKRYTVRWR